MAKKLMAKKLCIWCENEGATDVGGLCVTCLGECISEYEENHGVCGECSKPKEYCECDDSD